MAQSAIDEQCKALGEEQPPDHIAVLPCNANALRLFRRVLGQWVFAPMGGPVAISYEAMYRVAESLQLNIDEDLLDRLQIMEREAIACFRKK